MKNNDKGYPCAYLKFPYNLKDLFDKTNLKTPGTEEIYYQQKNDEDEVEIGRNFFRGKEFKI